MESPEDVWSLIPGFVDFFFFLGGGGVERDPLLPLSNILQGGDEGFGVHCRPLIDKPPHLNQDYKRDPTVGVGVKVIKEDSWMCELSLVYVCMILQTKGFWNVWVFNAWVLRWLKSRI